MNQKTYKTIFFDLDHTLWDFDLNAKETLLELYDVHGINSYHSGSPLEFVEAYEKINRALWLEYEQQKITKDSLRTERFIRAFKEMGVPQKHLPENIWEDYLLRCPKKTNLIQDTIEICEYLSPKYKLHLITNGFETTQKTKIEYSKLEKYFHSLTTSECVGLAKPHPKIYLEALKKANSNPEECLMIGDNLTNDVLGAMENGIDAIWFNPSNLSSEKPVREIKYLKELLALL